MTFAFLAGAIRCGLSAGFGALFTGDSRGFGFATSGVAACGLSLLGATAITFSSATARARGFDCRVTVTGAFLVTTTGATSVTGVSTGAGAGAGTGGAAGVTGTATAD